MLNSPTIRASRSKRWLFDDERTGERGGIGDGSLVVESTPTKEIMKGRCRSGMLLLAIAVAVAASSLPSPFPVDANMPDHSSYTIDVDFEPVSRLLAGELVLDWRNNTGQVQESLYFRLYPNAPHYGDGSTGVSEVTVDGQAVDARLLLDRTVLELNIGHDVERDDRAEIAMTFETVVPSTSDASFGILGGDPGAGWQLADWFPILAGWEDDEGWYLDPPTRFGDPTYADSATFDLEFSAPDDYEVLGSGATVEETVNLVTDQVTTIIETSPGRDLTLSLLFDDKAGSIETTERSIAGSAVRVSLPRDEALPGLGAAMLEIAAETLPLYETWFGEHHDRELDIVAASLSGASGVSWHGIVWLDVDAIARDGQLSDRTLDTLRFVLTHELAHQWIAGIVGSNNNDHGFMTEGLANIVTVLAIREAHGVEVADRVLRTWVAGGYLAMLESGIDGVADAPVTDESDIVTRSQLIYGKGALGFEAIRQAIGNDAFFAGLAAYATEYRFQVSNPNDLLNAFEDAGSVDLDDLWSFWFDEERTTLADVDAILTGFAIH